MKTTITYTYLGEKFQAEVTRIENGTIFAKTLQPNGDWTLEHEVPASEICGAVSLIAERIPADVNRAVAGAIKALGLPVVGTAATLQISREPGRFWTKDADKSSTTAHG